MFQKNILGCLLNQEQLNFGAFAALTGYEDEVQETARLTSEKIELDEEVIKDIDRKLQMIVSHIEEHPLIVITYFIADTKKQGGRYETVSGNIKKIDSIEHLITLMDLKQINIENIIDIKSDLLKFN